jgi:hypothetical protein
MVSFSYSLVLSSAETGGIGYSIYMSCPRHAKGVKHILYNIHIRHRSEYCTRIIQNSKSWIDDTSIGSSNIEFSIFVIDIHFLFGDRYLVPRDMSVGLFIHILSSRLHLGPGKALFVFVKNTLPQTGIIFAPLNPVLLVFSRFYCKKSLFVFVF